MLSLIPDIYRYIANNTVLDVKDVVRLSLTCSHLSCVYGHDYWMQRIKQHLTAKPKKKPLAIHIKNLWWFLRTFEEDLCLREDYEKGLTRSLVEIPREIYYLSGLLDDAVYYKARKCIEMLLQQHPSMVVSYVTMQNAVKQSSLFLVQRFARNMTHPNSAFEEACQRNNYKIFNYLYSRVDPETRSRCLSLTIHNMQMFSRLWPEAYHHQKLDALIVAARKGYIGIIRRYLREIPEPGRRCVFQEAVMNAQKKIIVYTMRYVDLVEALPGFYLYQYVYLWESGIISKVDLALHGIVVDPLEYANEHLRYEQQHQQQYRDDQDQRRDAYEDRYGWSDDSSDYGPYDNGM